MITWSQFTDFIPWACLVGIAVGYLLRRRLSPWFPGLNSDAVAASREAQLQLEKLRDLTRSMAADVDEQAAMMRQIGEDLSSSDYDGEVIDAVSELIKANQRMHSQLEEAESRLETQARLIESSSREARTDALTQVANRRCFDDQLRQCQLDFERRCRPTCLMLVDVDHFKKFNDTQGHQAGDEVLRGVARVLQQAVGDTELVARYGGEEFAVLFIGTPLSSAVQLAEKARQAITDATFLFHGRPLRVTASSGIAQFNVGDDEKSLIRRADEALYAAKRGGRNCGYWNDGAANQRLEFSAESVSAGLNAALHDASPAEPSVAPNDSNLGLSARNVFIEDLARQIAHCNRGTAPMSLLLLQVDRMNRVLEDRGPKAVARIIRIVTQLLKATMRDMDHLSLISDDTFALLLPGAKLHDSASIGERVRTNVEQGRLARHVGAVPSFTVSIGIVEALETDDLRQVMERARLALQAAVRKGRNGTWVHDGNEICPVEDLGLLPQ